MINLTQTIDDTDNIHYQWYPMMLTNIMKQSVSNNIDTRRHRHRRHRHHHHHHHHHHHNSQQLNSSMLILRSCFRTIFILPRNYLCFIVNSSGLIHFSSTFPSKKNGYLQPVLLSARPLSSSLRSSGACWMAWWIMWGPTSASPSRRPHAMGFHGDSPAINGYKIPSIWHMDRFL